MTTTMNKETAILEILDNLDDETLIQVWNNYCDENRNDEDHIYPNVEYEINELLDGKTPFDIITSVETYNPTDDYFVDGIYGIKSFDDIDEVICKSDLARAILRESYILTSVSDEDDWAETLIEHFEIFLCSAGIASKVNWEEYFDADDLMTSDWADLLDDLDPEE